MSVETLCPHCGKAINPAAMLGSRKKTMTPAAIEARRYAAKQPRPNHKKKGV